MTDHLGVRMVCSRGRVCCDRCGRRIPKGTRYEQYDYADGGIYHSRTCPTCLDIEGYVADDLDPDMPWGPSESWEWAHDAMGWWSGWSDSVLGDADPSLATIALRTLSRDVEAAAGLDNDPPRRGARRPGRPSPGACRPAPASRTQKDIAASTHHASTPLTVPVSA